MTKINVLVTGCGGDIGQSVGKILRTTFYVGNSFGTDIHGYHPGKFFYDQTFIVPPCNDEDYLNQLESIVKSKNIDLIIPVSEPELRFFLEHGYIESIFSKPLLIANKEALSVGFDKLMTVDFLIKNELPAPKTEIIRNISNPSLPFILKNRHGAGSRNIVYVENTEDFIYYQKKLPNYIAQEIISDNTMEFTCGLFSTGKGIPLSIVFRRLMTGGYSSYGEVVDNKNINDLLYDIAKAIKLKGSINVQLRLKDGVPYVFEINPRLSSTVLFRHQMGFTDLRWFIEALMWGKTPCNPENLKYSRFYKGYSEFFE